jgi:photosystem II stability/assembly factor-like uncharacterized protein
MTKAFIVLIFIFFSAVIAYSQPTWVDLILNPAPKFLVSVSTISHDVAWAGGFGGEVRLTTDGGLNWSNRGGGPLTNGNIYVIFALDAATAFAGVTYFTPGLSTAIYKTTNAGQQWIPTFIQQNGYLDDIKFINSLTGYAVGDPVAGRWTILKTTNGGNSWDSTGLRLAEVGNEFGWYNSMDVFFSGTASTIWFGTSQQHIYKSTNNGTTWNSFQTPAAAGSDIRSVVFEDAAVGYCGANNGVCKSVNGGQNWVMLANAIGTGEAVSVCYNTGRLWYARDNVIYFSADHGSSFTPQHTSPGSTPYQHMSFANTLTDEVLSIIGGYAITGKHFISKYTENNIGIRQIGSEIPKSFRLGQNYPNPFNPSTKIKFEIPASHNGLQPLVQIAVYDILGRKIAEIVNENLKPGSYVADWDASNFPSGVYFYKLNTENFSETKKMTVLK